MKFGTFLIIEACERLGLSVSITASDKMVYIKNGDKVFHKFIVSDVNSFSDEFYKSVKNVKYKKCEMLTNDIHSEIKSMRKDPNLLKRWERIRLRNSNLGQLLG